MTMLMHRASARAKQTNIGSMGVSSRRYSARVAFTISLKARAETPSVRSEAKT